MIEIIPVRNTLTLDDKEFNTLKTCIYNYQLDLSFNSLYTRVVNASQSLLGNSEWQKTREILEMHTYQFITSKCIVSDVIAPKLQEIVSVFSEFLLSFLVSQHAYVKGQSQFLIKKEVIQIVQEDQIGLEELIRKVLKETPPLLKIEGYNTDFFERIRDHHKAIHKKRSVNIFPLNLSGF
jgi:hypothetical protein